MSPDTAAVCARMMVANGLLLVPGFVSMPLVATNHVAANTDGVETSNNQIV